MRRTNAKMWRIGIGRSVNGNTYVRVGMTVELLGDGFTTASQVRFNGMEATGRSGIDYIRHPS